MLHASTQKLIVKLCELTETGHIAWQRGEGQTCRFETEGYVVEVHAQPPTLRLLHSDGAELERADEPELSAQPWPDGAGTFATHVTVLAARADRIARGAELAISRILSSLSAPPKAAPFDYLSSAPKPPVEPAEAPPPPAPHTAPGPPPDPIFSDTAIDRVLAVDPGPPPAAEPPAPEAAPEPVEPPRLEETPAPDPALQPVPRPEIPRPKNTFGATISFAKPKDLLAAPARPSPKPFSTSPIFFGVNQMSREPARTEPEPPPVPPPAAKPVPAAAPVAERKPAPAIAGPDIYKPWS